MSNSTVYKKGDFTVVQNGGGKGQYYTVVNTVDKSHTHVRPQSNGKPWRERIRSALKTAKIVAQKAHMGYIKKNHPYFMKLSTFRIMHEKDQENNLEFIKKPDYGKYSKKLVSN